MIVVLAITIAASSLFVRIAGYVVLLGLFVSFSSKALRQSFMISTVLSVGLCGMLGL